MQINGSTQIKDGTIGNQQISASAAIATSKLAEGADFIKRTGTVAFTADQSMGGFKLTNLATPTNATDATTKSYVDALVGTGLAPKDSAKFTTTGNITLSGLNTQAGGDWSATLTANDRILVKNQTNATENGIYVASATGWNRATDFNNAGNIKANSFLFVERGSTLADTGWVLTTDLPITVGSTNIVFVQFSSAGVILPGNALEKVGQTLNVLVGANGGVQIQGNALEIKLADATLSVGASGLQLANLPSTQILVGNGSNRPAAVAVSGDATLSNTGVLTVAATIARNANFVDEEVPTGAINGSNTSFNLAFTPQAGSVQLFTNGIRERYGVNFTVSGQTITYTAAPQTGDIVVVSYRK